MYCNVNRVKFSRVMDNLISNALKFTHYGGSIRIEIKQIQNEEILISIADTGIGIPASLQDDLFKPYTVSGREGTSNEKSTGLGLSITKEIVELHCGKIWFESKEGKGTTFFIILPGIKSNYLN
ncbi:MAG TPA: ATP-binding protein [Spirochaetota bacterium]|nr:ATP-binding protein [Spirochaetota bacterium]HQO22814.1 ATP-binding protein [Spirochaetota bacterium]HQQ23139.1 ATP-binding protein [Spirochaetota bacterium]